MAQMTLSMLDTAIINAHESGDRSGIMALYHEAALRFEEDGLVDGAAFFLTQAYVFALEAGDSLATDIAAKLRAMGRL